MYTLIRDLPEIAAWGGKAHYADSAIFSLFPSVCEFIQTDTPPALILHFPFSKLCPFQELILWLQYPKAILLFTDRHFTDVKSQLHLEGTK